MKQYTHGGNVYALKDKHKRIYDFSANINPLGVPESVVKAASKSLENCFHYPDPMCGELVEKIASYEGVKKEYIVCGNGAADLIFRMALTVKPKVTMVNAPTFSEYESAATMAESKVIYNLLKEENDFKTDEIIIEKIEEAEGLELLFLCNPNNPVGDLTHRKLLLKILDICKEKNIYVAVDECFIGFTEKEDEYSLKSFLGQYENLIIIKAFTKNFAMAGLRLGYIMSSNIGLLDKIFSCGQPWSVSTPAQAGGIAALDEREYFKRALKLIKPERKRLVDALKRKGCKVFEPSANYIFFKCKDGETFRKAMEEKGVLIRSCGNYHGLDEDYLRIAVRTHEENSYFIDAMEELI